MLPLWPAAVLFGASVGCVSIGVAAGFGRQLAGALAVLLVPLGLALVVVHGLLIERGAPLTVGPVAVFPDGVHHAVLLFARITLLLAVSLLFVMSTRPIELARALDAAGLQPHLSYLLVAPLALADAVQEEIRVLRDALAARGLGGGRWRDRIRIVLLVALLVPRGLMIEASPRAAVLEARGFRALSRRRVMDEIEEASPETWGRRALVLAAALQVVGAMAWP